MSKSSLSTAVAHLNRSCLLYKLVANFAEINLYLDVVSNHGMAYLSQELTVAPEMDRRVHPPGLSDLEVSSWG